MGHEASEEEYVQIKDLINDAHISEVMDALVIAAKPDDGSEHRLLLAFNSCCGVTVYAMPLKMAAELNSGLNGAFQRLQEIENNGKPN